MTVDSQTVIGLSFGAEVFIKFLLQFSLFNQGTTVQKTFASQLIPKYFL